MKWKKADAAKLLVKIAKWSVRAQFTGRIGGDVADEAFGDAAQAISNGSAKNQTSVRDLIIRLIPTDAEFREAFISYGDISVSRAKYLLAMLEKADCDLKGRPVKALDWHARSITIEHVLPLSRKNESEAQAASINRLGNMALLEKKLNHAVGSKAFEDKRDVYKESSFELTKKLYAKRTWKPQSVGARTKELAELACRAWPAE